MDTSVTPPRVFLAHAGADTEAALTLATRLRKSPEGVDARLEVWVDDSHMVPGHRWMAQLQDEIARSTAFVVYVGPSGVHGFVQHELDAAFERYQRELTAHPNYPLISVLAPGTSFDVLPSFLRGLHAVRDVEGSPDAFLKLLRVVLGHTDQTRVVRAEKHPFQGLSAFDASSAHLFFGRTRDTEQVIERLRIQPLVMVAGVSGAGKSSLVKAGVVPRFLKGALARPSSEAPDSTCWRVLETRPNGAPFGVLADRVFRAAQALEVTAGPASELADLVRSRDASKIRDAIHGLAHAAAPDGGARTCTLLVVDQFEELFTLASRDDQQAFAEVLLALTSTADESVRVILTMRWDHYGRTRDVPALFERLERNGGEACYDLRPMSDEELRQCVTEPLNLAGVELSTREALADVVLRDVHDRLNDLALLEVALHQTWEERGRFRDDLRSAYESIGRVFGALTKVADRALNKLSLEEQDRCEGLFVRLVKLGDTGGATRRIASQEELDGGRWELAQKLATEEYKRLLVVSDSTAEIAHEALVTTWPRYSQWLWNLSSKEEYRDHDKRRLDALADDAREWEARGKAEGLLPNEVRLTDFEALRRKRPRWLARREHQFVDAGIAVRRAKARRRARIKTTVVVTAIAVIVAAIFLTRRSFVQADITQLLARFDEDGTLYPVEQAALFDIHARPRGFRKQLSDAFITSGHVKSLAAHKAVLLYALSGGEPDNPAVDALTTYCTGTTLDADQLMLCDQALPESVRFNSLDLADIARFGSSDTMRAMFRRMVAARAAHEVSRVLEVLPDISPGQRSTIAFATSDFGRRRDPLPVDNVLEAALERVAKFAEVQDRAYALSFVSPLTTLSKGPAVFRYLRAAKTELEATTDVEIARELAVAIAAAGPTNVDLKFLDATAAMLVEKIAASADVHVRVGFAMALAALGSRVQADVAEKAFTLVFRDHASYGELSPDDVARLYKSLPIANRSLLSPYTRYWLQGFDRATSLGPALEVARGTGGLFEFMTQAEQAHIMTRLADLASTEVIVDRIDEVGFLLDTLRLTRNFSPPDDQGTKERWRRLRRRVNQILGSEWDRRRLHSLTMLLVTLDRLEYGDSMPGSTFFDLDTPEAQIATRARLSRLLELASVWSDAEKRDLIAKAREALPTASSPIDYGELASRLWRLTDHDDSNRPLPPAALDSSIGREMNRRVSLRMNQGFAYRPGFNEAYEVRTSMWKLANAFIGPEGMKAIELIRRLEVRKEETLRFITAVASRLAPDDAARLWTSIADDWAHASDRDVRRSSTNALVALGLGLDEQGAVTAADTLLALRAGAGPEPCRVATSLARFSNADKLSTHVRWWPTCQDDERRDLDGALARFPVKLQARRQ